MKFPACKSPKLGLIKSTLNYDFSKCKYTADELNGKTVFVHIQIGHKKFYQGAAKFEAVQNQDGLVRVAVNYNLTENDGSINAAKISIASESLHRIVKNSGGSEFEFSMNTVVRINDEFTAEDVHGQLVNFSIRTNDGHIYGGEGRLVAMSAGKVAVGVLQSPTAVGPVFMIAPHDIIKLVRNPPGSKCAFSFKNS